jgi:cell volume regulation protein A
VDALNLALLAAGTLIFASVLTGLFSARAGFSFLLVFLFAGMLVGEDGPGGVEFGDFRLAYWVGNAALAVILLDGGLRTTLDTFRTGLKPALGLATLGVLVTAAVTGAAAAWLLGVEWRLGLLAGAIVGSTDAAAVFSLMRTSQLRLNERMATTLEIESGINDPMAVFLTMMLIAWIATPGTTDAQAFALLFVQQAGWGLAVGLAGGWLLGEVLRRLRIGDDDEAIAGLLLLSSGVAVFGGANLAGGSGFLAVYLYGLVLRHRAAPVVRSALAAMDGFAWLSQAAMFLLLGLLVTPSRMVDQLLPALGVAAVLMLVARPLAVWLCLAPLRFTRAEMAFVSWVGLRGAVPIVLAVFPVVSGVPGARLLFDVAFVVVLASLLLQGTTMRWAAQRFGVNLPDVADESAHRALFGDFVLDAATPLADLCAFYGLPLPEDGPRELGAWLAWRLGRPPVVGDTTEWGGAQLSVRTLDGARIARVGLRLGVGGAPP